MLTNNPTKRREFIKQSMMAASMLAFSPLACQRSSKSEGPYGGFRVGVQSFSFRWFTIEQAIEMTAGLGLKYIEIWPGHATRLGEGKSDKSIQSFHLNPQRWEKTKAALQKYGIRCPAYGVAGLRNDESFNRAIFDFAKKEGIETIVAKPSLDSYDLLDKLVNEYKINIAVHNHGVTDKLYAKYAAVSNAVNGHNSRIGAVVDVGHYAIVDQDPVKAIRTLGNRVFGVHLRDMDENKKWTDVGKGILDIPGIFATLKDVGFNGLLSIEYPPNPENPVPGIKASLEYMQKLL